MGVPAGINTTGGLGQGAPRRGAGTPGGLLDLIARRRAQLAQQERDRVTGAVLGAKRSDETRTFVRELARANTERLLRRSRGRAGAFLSPEPYRAPGSRSTTG